LVGSLEGEGWAQRLVTTSNVFGWLSRLFVVDRALEAVALPVTVPRLGNKLAARPRWMRVHDEVKFGDNPRRCRSTFCVERRLTVIGWIMEEL
jgi:hypothetical protein